MKLCGFSPNGIKISLFNIEIIETSRHYIDFKADIMITAAGPLVGIATYLIALPICTAFAYVNLLIGLFNLLPAASLDGGQLLYLFLSKHFSGEKSAKIVDIVTLVASFPLLLVGILVLLNSYYNFSLLFLSLYLILSIFIRKDKYL
ncbi:MAG: site-2 protease family protein [Ruminococcus sp.]|nr:site-2 protease family protein [Ruminococcus sp.]